MLRLGSFADGSFSSDIVIINYFAFVKLLNKYFNDKKIADEIESKCKMAIKAAGKTEFSWTEVAQKLADSAASEIPKTIRGIIAPKSTVSDIVNVIVNVLKK